MNLLQFHEHKQQILIHETTSKIIKNFLARKYNPELSKRIKKVTQIIVRFAKLFEIDGIIFRKEKRNKNKNKIIKYSSHHSINEIWFLHTQRIQAENKLKTLSKNSHHNNCQITVHVKLRTNSHRQINSNRSKIITVNSLRQNIIISTNNNNRMITSNYIVTPPWAASMISTTDGPHNKIITNTISTDRATATTTHWSNAYEMSTSNVTNPANDNNSHLINRPNATENNTNSIFGNNDNLEDDNDDSEVLRTIEYIGTVLNFYYVPIIVGTGSIGNILSVFVFFRTKLCKLSSSYYLAALAVSDTCFLLGLFAQWLNFVDVHIYNREYFCQFFTFFSNLSCFCSVWFVVAFTVERFIAVMYPLRRQTMCTVRRAKMVLIGLAVLGCLHCAPFWISSTPVYSPKLETTICDIKSEYKDYITLLNYWDTIVVFAVPFTTIAVLNTFTGCTVWKFATVRRTLTMQKIKTQHLPLHGIISSPSSSCSMPENSLNSANTVATTTATGGGGGGGAKTATTSMIEEKGISTFRISTSSLKRQKSASCASLAHTNVQHNNHVVDHHRQHHNHHHEQQHYQHQHHALCAENEHIHAHPNRATVIKNSTNCNNHADIFTRKSKRRKVTNSSQLKVTKMLLIVSTVFVCLNLPSFIMRMITYLETQSSANEKTTVVLQYIFQLLFVTNFGINFVLYCVSGQNFRKAVLSMFRKVSTAQRDGATQITVSEYYRNSGGIAAACGTNVSARRRMLTQNCWNEVHELQRLK